MATTSAPSLAAAVACLTLLASGCARQVTAAPGGADSVVSELAGDYLRIAGPANRELDQEVDAYDNHAHGDVSAAESALRAEAATERRFDYLLLRIEFPPPIQVTARALVAVNQRRIALTEMQAQSASTAGLVSFTGRHKSADAAVEAQVRIIRRQLGLPPPENG